MTDQYEGNDLLEKTWEEREELIYKSIFKNLPDEIVTIEDPSQVVIGGDMVYNYCLGVFVIPPSDDCKYWTYLTSGISNHYFEEPSEISGYGFELLIQTQEKCYWPVNLLFNLMGYIFTTGDEFEMGYCFPSNGPINASEPNCLLTTLLFWQPANLKEDKFKILSGEFNLVQIHGITDEECQFAEDHSADKIYKILQTLPNFPAIDTSRSSLI